MCSMVMPRSTALHISYTVSNAALAAVSASISTPVRPTVSTVTAQSTVEALRFVVNSTSMRVNASG
jgi:hypothetical protein